MCTDPNAGQSYDVRNKTLNATTQVLKIKEFQLCKKAEIQQEKITI